MGQFRYLERPGGGAKRSYSASLLKSIGYRGRYECELIAWTPLDVGGVADVLDGSGTSRVGARKKQRQGRKGQAPEEFKPFNVDPIEIPGTGLKGMLRALAEFVAAGCYRIHDRRNAGDPPSQWKACSNPDRVCTCCDMFGGIFGRGGGLRGKVRVGDGVLVGKWNVATERELSADRHPPRRPRRLPGGAVQKFFLHEPWDPRPWQNRRGNATFYPVKVGTRFRFTVDFDGLDVRELALLDWCLFLQPGLLHKLGKGKAIGLGSIGIRCLAQEIEKLPDRLAGDDARWTWCLEKADEEKKLLDHADERLPSEALEERKKIEQRKDLQTLREIMQWPDAEKPGTPLEIPGSRVPVGPPPPPPPVERWIRAPIKEYRPQTSELVIDYEGERYTGRGDFVREFVKGLSKGKQKKLKKGGLIVEARVRAEGPKREILEVRLPEEDD